MCMPVVFTVWGVCAQSQEVCGCSSISHSYIKQ